MKLFHTFTGAVLILLACNTKSEEKNQKTGNISLKTQTKMFQ